MDKLFKRNSKKAEPQISDNESSTASSAINEDIIPSSPKSPAPPKPVRPRLNDQDVQKHTSITWPRLPQLALTTSQDSQTYGAPTSHAIEVLYTDTEAGSDVELNDNVQKHRRRISYDGDDGSCSDVGSLHNDRHKNENRLDDSGANTLVEAALDKEEAKFRHIRFQDHVAESAALVQRMLSMKSGHRQAPDALQSAMLNRHDSRNSDEEISLHQTHKNLGGGSVLASLMRLEAARVDGENKKIKKRPKVRQVYNHNIATGLLTSLFLGAEIA